MAADDRGDVPNRAVGLALAGLAAARLLPYAAWVAHRPVASVGAELDAVGALLLAWPLGVGLAWRWTGWPPLARAVAVAATVLVLDRALTLSAWFALGGAASGARAGPPGLRGGWATGSMVVLGLAELAVAAGAWRAARGAASARAGPRWRSRPRQALTVGIGVHLALFLGWLTAWDAYHALLHLPRVRQYVLRVDRRDRSPDREPPPLPPLAREGIDALQAATNLAFGGRYAEAKAAYLRAIDALGRLARPPAGGDEARARLGLARNNLAWLLATCPDRAVRDPRGALALAERAVAGSPHDGGYWNTLGAAQFRAGDPDAAERSLGRSMALRRGGDGFDWYYLSLVHARRGDPAGARQFLDRADGWAGRNQPNDPELRRLSVEAAGALEQPPAWPEDLVDGGGFREGAGRGGGRRR